MGRLVDVILRSAMKKGATRIVVAGTTVHFEVAGELEVDTDVPPAVRDYLIERLTAMAELPAGQPARGQIMLEHRGDRATFAIEVDGARAELTRV